MRISLVGLPGSGKSYWGKLISQHLDLPFFDLDKVIEEREWSSIPEIFEEKGEIYFRQLEHDCLKQQIQSLEPFVLSTGGGTPCFHGNMELLVKHTDTIYLNESVESIALRLMQEPDSRPLLKGVRTTGDLEAKLNDLLSEREKYYRKANYVVQNKVLQLKDFIELVQ